MVETDLPPLDLAGLGLAIRKKAGHLDLPL
jgi:hypothetical protein